MNCRDSPKTECTILTQMRPSFHVVVRYREPSYEAYAGAKEQPYRWTFAANTSDAREATALAVDEFRRMERLSSVGWVREIVDVEVSSVPQDRPPLRLVP